MVIRVIDLRFLNFIRALRWAQLRSPRSEPSKSAEFAGNPQDTCQTLKIRRSLEINFFLSWDLLLFPILLQHTRFFSMHDRSTLFGPYYVVQAVRAQAEMSRTQCAQHAETHLNERPVRLPVHVVFVFLQILSSFLLFVSTYSDLFCFMEPHPQSSCPLLRLTLAESYFPEHQPKVKFHIAIGWIPHRNEAMRFQTLSESHERALPRCHAEPCSNGATRSPRAALGASALGEMDGQLSSASGSQ